MKQDFYDKKTLTDGALSPSVIEPPVVWLATSPIKSKNKQTTNERMFGL
jgi:hypothetical protein